MSLEEDLKSARDDLEVARDEIADLRWELREYQKAESEENKKVSELGRELARVGPVARAAEELIRAIDRGWAVDDELRRLRATLRGVGACVAEIGPRLVREKESA